IDLSRRAVMGKVAAGIVMTDAAPRKAFFNDLLPSTGNPVQLQLSPTVLRPISEGYVPTPDDVFVLPVSLSYPAPKNETPPLQSDPRYVAWLNGIKKRWEAGSQEYSEQSMARARASTRTVVSSTPTLRAKLPPR